MTASALKRARALRDDAATLAAQRADLVTMTQAYIARLVEDDDVMLANLLGMNRDQTVAALASLEHVLRLVATAAEAKA